MPGHDNADMEKESVEYMLQQIKMLIITIAILNLEREIGLAGHRRASPGSVVCRGA